MAKIKFRINRYPTSDRPNNIRDVYEPEKYYKPAKYKYVSRYSEVRTMSEFNLPYHETIYKRGVVESDGDKYYTVDNTTINRLDIISQMYYGYPIYWWVIAEANDIINPFDIPRDTILRIPPLSSLYLKGGVLSGDY